MDKAEIIKRLRSERDALEARGVEHLAIFGSRARGDHRPDSDLDVLLEVPWERKFSLIDLVGVERIIGKAVEAPVTALMRRSVRSDFMARIAPDVTDVF
ncbi:MAG: nucleotidyltransferase family protein [Beijerinckiaceae bacterium]